MTSKEMEARSGVPRANIRYYEAEGLLAPARSGNGYRDYSEEDLRTLEKIKLLRRLGVTIEALRALRDGRAELSAVLDRRLAEVGGEQAALGRVERGDAYLMLHRVKKKGDLNHDKWIGVGGKFEDGESPEDCILRETWEETGLTLTDYRYRGLVTFVSDEAPTEYMHLFTATGWTGTPHPCDEGELAWIKKAELRGLPMWEGDKIFLRLLEENVPFFSLKLQYQGDRLDRAVLNGRRIV